MQNTCPSGAILRSFRGRRHFENAIGHTFPGKSRPLEDILYIHRARLKKCIASAITECSASAPENALPLLLRNVPPSLHEMFRLCYYRMLSPSPHEKPCLRFRNKSPRPMECKTPVHRARYCGLFAAVGILKMPSGTLSRENRGRWSTFYISTGRAQRNASPPLLEMFRLCYYEKPRLHFRNALVTAKTNVLSPDEYCSAISYLA